MKKTKPKQIYYFVDESGDPNFYDKYGNFILASHAPQKPELFNKADCRA